MEQNDLLKFSTLEDGNQVRKNNGSMKIPQISEEVMNTTIVSFLKAAGYELVYGGKEQLLDLIRDPYETTHFTNDPEYEEKLVDLRKAFETEWFPGY